MTTITKSKKKVQDINPPCINGGFVCMPKDELNKIIEAAAKKGASEVLSSPEISEIKDILAAFRSAKGVIWIAFLKTITTFIIFSIIAGIGITLSKPLH